MEKMKKEEVKRDRISELPEEIKEQIISSLCMKDAICTSALSSVWRYSWVSLPFLDFGLKVYSQFSSYFETLPTTHPKKRHLYSIFHNEEQEEEDIYEWQIDNVGYLQMVDEFLQVYIEKNQSLRVLKKMSIYVPTLLYNSKRCDYGADIVSRCLSLAKHNVTELDYWVDDFEWHYRALLNCLPILESKTLTKLKLWGCYLATRKKVDLPIDLPNLKHLSLSDMIFDVDENMLENLIAQCRALEKLEFYLCRGIKVLRVPRVSKLRELKVRHVDLDQLEINAMTLQCLTLNKLTTECKIKMASNCCYNLVNLFVDCCGITDDFFNNVAEFPHLETVSLIACPELKHIKISGNSLTSLDIKECPNLSQAEVDSPKLFFSGNSSRSKNVIKRLFPKTQSFIEDSPY